jgi:pimeloyl-ACP methyl ester carboxylesterase
VPVEGPDGEEIEVAVGADGLRLILAWDLGDGQDIPVLPALLYTLDQGDTSILGWFVRKRLPALGGGMPAMHFAMEGASGASAERWRRIEREASAAILDDVVDRLYPAVADAFGIAAADDAFRAPIVSEVETLFLSGTLDSNTPPFQAEEVRWGFTASTHLQVEHAGHEDMLGDPEVTEVLVDFFSGRSVAAHRLSLP